MRGVVFVAVVLASFAGCVEEAPAKAKPGSPFLVAPGEARANSSYAFVHPGGELALRSSGASIAIFDADDRLVGAFDLGGSVRLDLDGGSYAIRIGSLSGALSMEAGGVPVPLIPLSVQVDRVILAQVPHGPLPGVPLVPGEQTRTQLNVTLPFAPSDLVLLADGSFSDLHLTLQSERGELFRSDWGGGKFPDVFRFGFDEVPSSFDPLSASGRNLRGQLTVSGLQGAIVLEAWGPSRAVPFGLDRVSQQDAPSFDYGRLPAVPVAFHVAANATRLGFSGDGWVALFGPDDRKIASVPAALGRPSSVAVGGGEYVAVALSGNVSVSADAPPPDLGYRILKSHQRTLPTRAAGDRGDYGQDRLPVDGAGLYEILMDTVHPTRFDPLGCFAKASARVLVGSDAAASWGDWDASSAPTGVFLDDRAELWHDGFGRHDCPRAAATVLSYTRDL